MDLILQINKAHEKKWITFAMAETESMASAPNTGDGRKLFSICICTVDLILQVNKAYSE